MVAFLKDCFFGGFMNSKDETQKNLDFRKRISRILGICHFNEWSIESFKIYNIKK
jgi:hypothetical protein